jgi:peptidoglycan/xylan/chitin deacetylase (PgdA/CDA1 family)
MTTGSGVAWRCLMYHDVLPETVARGGGPDRFAVPLDSFEIALDTIRDLGLRGTSLARQRASPRPDAVVISFDDGNVGQFEYAAPALRARGMTATFFVTTDWIGTDGFMTWDQLRQLKAWGMSVQSHTKSHPFLSELDEVQLLSELAGSKAALDGSLRQDTLELSLPGGNAPKRKYRHLLRHVGYRVVAGSRWGSNVGDAAGSLEGRWVRRCTMRGRVESGDVTGLLGGHPRMALSHHVKEPVLYGMRGLLGPTRYARWRRRFLDSLPSL